MSPTWPSTPPRPRGPGPRSTARQAPSWAPSVRRAERIAQILDAAGDFVPAARRAEVARAIAKLRAAARTGESIARLVDEMAAIVEHGDGSIGGLLADKELFDDLHETHRILKNQAWKLIIKPRPGARTPSR